MSAIKKSPAPKEALLILAEGFEEIEALTPVDLLRRSGIAVRVLGLETETVTGSHGITVQADGLLNDFSLSSGSFPDALILPGGLPGAENLGKSALLRDILIRFREEKALIAALCAAPGLVLEKAGLLDGRSFTGYPGFHTPALHSFYHEEQSVVSDQNIITGQGAGVTLEFSLAVIAYLLSPEEADHLAAQIRMPRERGF